jgi:hypothetical protein
MRCSLAVLLAGFAAALTHAFFPRLRAGSHADAALRAENGSMVRRRLKRSWRRWCGWDVM